MPISVRHPFGAARDAELPSLSLALNPAVVKQQFRRRLKSLAGETGTVRLRAIRVTRYKPGRRCVIEYDVKIERPNVLPQTVTLIGKVRARRSGTFDYELQRALWNGHFNSKSLDGIEVAEPIGILWKLRLWLQRKVPGQLATDLLSGQGGAMLARRIAEAAHKLHQAGLATPRRHTMADELRILHRCLQSVSQLESRWAPRLERLYDACERLAAATPLPIPCGIHRD